MKPIHSHVLLLVMTLLSLSLPVRAASLAQTLAKEAPLANPYVIELAAGALQCAVSKGMERPARLAVIDYSLPSTAQRMWVFDVARQRLLHQELVAHGRNSGDNYAQSFSNQIGSLQSSLGLFRTRETYVGRNGYSLRMDGMEQGINDRAMERAIVIHGAPYVNPDFIRQHGRIGRSLGCPAVRAGVAREIIDTLKNGQFVFAYYPDQRWLAESAYLNCGKAPLTQLASKSASAKPRDNG
jgi:hypothetical protein